MNNRKMYISSFFAQMTLLVFQLWWECHEVVIGPSWCVIFSKLVFWLEFRSILSHLHTMMANCSCNVQILWTLQVLKSSSSWPKFGGVFRNFVDEGNWKRSGDFTFVRRGNGWLQLCRSSQKFVTRKGLQVLESAVAGPSLFGSTVWHAMVENSSTPEDLLQSSLTL